MRETVGKRRHSDQITVGGVGCPDAADMVAVPGLSAVNTPLTDVETTLGSLEL